MAWVAGHFTGDIAGVGREAHREGLTDSTFRVAVNLLGGPALRVEDFLKTAPAKTVVGASLRVVVPTGQYVSTRAINPGAHRWGFKPEIGVSHRARRLILDGYAGVWLFTANDNYLADGPDDSGSVRQQSPIGSFEAHVSYDVTRRLWILARRQLLVRRPDHRRRRAERDLVAVQLAHRGHRRHPGEPAPIAEVQPQRRRDHPHRRQVHGAVDGVAGPVGGPVHTEHAMTLASTVTPLRAAVAFAACLALASCSGSAPDPTPADQAALDAADQQALAESSAAYALPDVSGIKWTGDLDGMVKRRIIRVLTTYSKVNYFVDQGRPRGLVYDAFRLFEDDLNARLKRRNVKIHVVFVPVAHDDLIPALLDGRGDVVAAGTLVTEWRTAQVDATVPTRSNISSIIVTGPGVPPVASPLDLGGRDVYLRRSDVSTAGVAQFNAQLAKAGRPPVRLLPAPEVLADEDILEMVNAGLVPATMAEDYVAEFWHQVFPDMVLNTGAAVRTNGQTGMLVRKNSPQLLAELNRFLARYPAGSKLGNLLLNQYRRASITRAAPPPTPSATSSERTVELFRKYGDRYELDALLMTAQGYQESQLDQAGQEPGRRDRRHAGDAGDRQGDEGRRHQRRSSRTSTPASSTCAS